MKTQMKMITEDYVNFEIAKLLKEKGFDEVTAFVYSDKGELLRLSEFAVRDLTNNDCDEYSKWQFPIEDVSSIISAPTLQMAMKWLWETHRLYVSPCLTIKKLEFTFLNQWHCIVAWVDKDNQYDLKCIGEGYSSYQEACEAGIKYCLEKKLAWI